MENSKDGEEEEIIVYASFEEGTVDKEIFQQSDLKFKIIGLDSDNPIVQLGDTTYKGAWKDTIGTKVFFEEDTCPDPVDPVFTVIPPKMLKYKCMTTKSLELSRIFLKQKNSENSANLDYIDLNNKKEDYSFSEEKEVGNKDILNLVKNTINPDDSTVTVMADIVKKSAADILENNCENK